MSYQPIENYGIIGNMRTVALVGMNGSIDWYCYPHFDSPSIFGAILDDKNGGCFRISAASDSGRHKQLYWPSTNVLVTRFLLTDGIAELEDFMPVGLPPNATSERWSCLDRCRWMRCSCDDPPDVNRRAKSYSAADHLINPITLIDHGKTCRTPGFRGWSKAHLSDLRPPSLPKIGECFRSDTGRHAA